MWSRGDYFSLFIYYYLLTIIYYYIFFIVYRVLSFLTTVVRKSDLFSQFSSQTKRWKMKNFIKHISIVFGKIFRDVWGWLISLVLTSIAFTVITFVSSDSLKKIVRFMFRIVVEDRMTCNVIHFKSFITASLFSSNVMPYVS